MCLTQLVNLVMINKLKDETDVTQVSHAVRFTIAFTCSFAILPQGFVHGQMWAYV